MLAQRVATGIVGGAVFLFCVVQGSWYMIGFFAAIGLVAQWEVISMPRRAPHSLSSVVTLIATLAIALSGTAFFMRSPLLTSEMVIWAALWILLLYKVLRNQSYTFARLALELLGAVYIGFSVRAVLGIRMLPLHGLGWLVLVLLSIWATDIFAYFIGGWLKGPKLAPTLSPKKTVSGALGGLFFALAVGLCFPLAMHGQADFPLWRTLLISLCTSLAGQVGDLAESALKRSYGVKDSGSILPGHGGILDRFDSLLFAAPLAYHLIVLSS